MKHAYKNIKDAVKMAYKLDHFLPLYALEEVLEAVIPFIAIWLSAYVLDCLGSGMRVAEFLPIVLLGVGGTFAIKLIASRLELLHSSRFFAAYWRYQHLGDDKNMELDYQQLDDPEILARKKRIKADSNWGSGIANTYAYFAIACAGMVRIILSAVTLYPILSNPVFYTQWQSLAFILIAALATAVPLLYHFRIQAPKEKIFIAKSTAQWRGVFYYLFGGFDYKFGKDVRVYNAEPLIRKYMHAGEKEGKEMSVKMSKVGGMGGGLTGMAEGLIMGGSYLFVTLLALSGNLSAGIVVRAAAGFYQMAQGVSGLILTLSAFAVDTERLQSTFEYLTVPTILYKGSVPVEKRRDNEYEIEFRDVSFKYPGSDQWALRNLNLRLRIGEKLAVVGQNGSGKTTMIKLLCRLYDPTEGVITLNGVDIRKYRYQEYMDIFSVVFQDFKLLSLGLGQNVAASDEIDRERAIQCLEKAGFGERLQTLENGLDTILNKDYSANGVEISGGEAQKVALARALYKHAPFVVLDEPTAALDPLAEFDIYSRFNDIVDDRTAIYISHRLSSCRFCQDIAVFHEGMLIQRGSHDDLLSDESGKYHELWHAQAKHYTKEE